jgi:hypothetical protein
MSCSKSHPNVKLDPWSASSLLQKAIRRSEVELARSAAQTLYRQRGVAVFRRLCTIAVEDIGIADVRLLHEVTRIGTDKALREVLGPDAELIDDLVSQLALTTKDRSADYLYCAATKLETALADQRELSGHTFDRLVELATDDGAPLPRRAVASLLACTAPGDIEGCLIADRVNRLLEAFSFKLTPLADAVMKLARSSGEPFCIMLPLIWSRWWYFGAEATVVEEDLPVSEFVNGVPLHTWDKHTAAGKQAIGRFARENETVASALQAWAPMQCRRSVVEIAAFYADAAPVARRLNWPTGTLLKHMGFTADMIGAGCAFEGHPTVFKAVQENLPHLNRLRAHLICRSRK